jgi:hypothetical protein
MDRLYVDCECLDPEHVLVLDAFEDDPVVFIHVHLTDYDNPLKRLWKGIKYILGYRCQYGHWDEMVLNPEGAEKLVYFLIDHLDELDTEVRLRYA